MEQFTDDERVEDIKKWWKDNGASILAGIALGVIAIFGWQYWNSHRNAQAEKASLAYDAFIVAAEQPDAGQTRQRGQALLADFPNSAYAALAALRLAKLEIDGGDTAAAIQRLEWVTDNARLDEFKDIARLRLARVLLAAGQQAEAEKLMERVTTPSLTAEREELKGDLYLAGNDPARARTAYAAARAAGGDNPLLQLKIDNLAVPTADTVVAASAEPPPATSAETAPSPAETAPSPAETAPSPAVPTTDTAPDQETAPAPTPSSAPTSGQ
jgi:predicted negative regulator of RcsB-dependent stress response